MTLLIDPLSVASGTKVLEHLTEAHVSIGRALVHPSMQDTVREHLHSATRSLQSVEQTMITAGYRHGGKAPTAQPVPLHLLDTPDTRQLLALLTEAQAIAERIDASRGRSLSSDVPLQPGESAGCDLAESISYLTLRLDREVNGVKGRD